MEQIINAIDAQNSFPKILRDAGESEQETDAAEAREFRRARWPDPEQAKLVDSQSNAREKAVSLTRANSTRSRKMSHTISALDPSRMASANGCARALK